MSRAIAEDGRKTKSFRFYYNLHNKNGKISDCEFIFVIDIGFYGSNTNQLLNIIKLYVDLYS